MGEAGCAMGGEGVGEGGGKGVRVVHPGIYKWKGFFFFFGGSP